jgi:hypothetical protein
MNLRALVIYLEEDGFRIDNPERDIPDGTPLLIFYEIASGWETREIAFYPQRKSLLHPFTKNGMFVYTGEEPVRVLIKAVDGDLPVSTQLQDQYDYRKRNFYSYPDYDDSIWDDDLLRGILYYNTISSDVETYPPLDTNIETPGPFADAGIPSSDAPGNEILQPPQDFPPQDVASDATAPMRDEGIDEGDQSMYPETSNDPGSGDQPVDTPAEVSSDPNAY